MLSDTGLSRRTVYRWNIETALLSRMDALTSLALLIVSGDVHNKIPVTQCSVLIL